MQYNHHLFVIFVPYAKQSFFIASLQFTPAARATFLMQADIVITPLLSLLAGEHIQLSAWAGCTLAVIGVILISTSAMPKDGAAYDTPATTAPVFNKGDAMIVAVSSYNCSNPIYYFLPIHIFSFSGSSQLFNFHRPVIQTSQLIFESESTICQDGICCFDVRRLVSC